MITYYLITLLSFLIPAFLFFLLWTFFVFRKKNNFGRALLFFVAAFSCGIAMEGKLQLPLLILFVSIPFALSLSKGFFERFFCLNNFILRKHKQVLIFLKSRPKKPFDRLRANGEFVQQISKKITTTLLLSLIFFCAGFFSMAPKKNIIHQKNQFLN